MFFSEKKNFFLWQEKRGYIDSWTNFLWENIISELCIKNNVMIMFMQAEKYLYECLITCQSEKTYIWNWSKILCTKTLIKSIICCQTVPLNRLHIYVMKIVCQASLLSFLTWVSLSIFYLDQCQMKIVCSAQHHCHW